MKHLPLFAAAALCVVGAVGVTLPAQAASRPPHASQAGYHPNCSENPYSPNFRMGGCGGGEAAAKKKRKIGPKHPTSLTK